MRSLTLLHLAFPVIVSLIGIAMLLRAVNKQRQLRRQYRLTQPKLAIHESMPINEKDSVAAQASALTREDQRLTKLGFNNLQQDVEADFDDVLTVDDLFEEENTISQSQPMDVEQQGAVTPPEIVILHIFAKDNKHFVGYELLQAILACGFRFGDMAIFHRHQRANGRGKVLFSLASAVEPGTFDMNAMGGYTCSGLTFFMCPEQVKQAVAVFDLMLTTAKELASDLDGILLDEQHQSLSAETVAHIRHSLQYLPNQTAQAELDFSLE